MRQTSQAVAPRGARRRVPRGGRLATSGRRGRHADEVARAYAEDGRTVGFTATGLEGARIADLHEDRRRGHDRPGRRPARPEGFAPGRDLRHGRRAELADRRRARHGPVRAARRPSSRRSRTSCSTSAPTCAGRPTTRGARGSRPSRRATSRSSSGSSTSSTTSVGPLTNFLLPGGSPGAAQLHVARTICRRAEREAIRLGREEPIGELVLPYLNRLSDALFVMARYENHERGVAEPLWQPGA